MPPFAITTRASLSAACFLLSLLAACAGPPAPSQQPSPSAQASPSASPRPAAASCVGSGATATAEALSIERWPGGAEAAISLTIDEGLDEPFTVLMPEIELRGWRASFYVYTDQPTRERTWDRVILAHQRGHEVSTHTHSHPNLTKLSDEQVHAELRKGNEELRARLGQALPLQSFAYPYEATDARVSGITLQYHRYARAGDHGAPTPPYPINDAISPDFGALKAKAPTRSVSLADWNRWTDATLTAKGWFIEELHGVEDIGQSGGWEPRTLADFRAHFDHIESYGERIWVAPVRRVGNYIESRQAAKATVKAWSREGLVFSLEDGHSDQLLSEPLSLRLRLPQDWPAGAISASQNGKSLSVRRLGSQELRVMALPDGKPVCILPG